jgi:hypothetical protein
MENEKKKENDSLEGALKNVDANEHQDLAQENLGIEPEEQTEGDPNSPYRLKGFDDKRPASKEIKKGWTVDSDTSRAPEDLH